MGYDLNTWSPAVGGAGGDQYDPPANTRIDVGASDYSGTPTIAEINARSGINQVIALINRRILRYNALFGTSMTTLAYLTAAARVKASDITAIANKINTLRTTEGFASYTFPTSEIAAGKLIKGSHLAELRRALRIAGVMTLPANILKHYVRDESAYNTPISETVYTGYADGFGGNNYTNVGKIGSLLRARFCSSYPIPDWLSAAMSTAMTVRVQTIQTNLEAFDAKLYSSDSDDHTFSLTPAYAGTAYHLDDAESSQFNPAAATTYYLAVAESKMIARAGSYLSLILGTAAELAGTGAGGSFGVGSQFLIDKTVGLPLVTDFGA